MLAHNIPPDFTFYIPDQTISESQPPGSPGGLMIASVIEGWKGILL
ncbi:hypothetical protein EFW58_02050 [Bacillus velezensis]|nr:hypothetical protein EFW58_02050 [Bacillus velezensis]